MQLYENKIWFVERVAQVKQGSEHVLIRYNSNAEWRWKRRTKTERKVIFRHEDVTVLVEESLWPEVLRVAPGLVHAHAVKIWDEHCVLKEITIVRLPTHDTSHLSWYHLRYFVAFDKSVFQRSTRYAQWTSYKHPQGFQNDCLDIRHPETQGYRCIGLVHNFVVFVF